MTLHVEIIGSGRPLVMLHGWGMHSGVWQPIIKKLAKHFELHLIDLPGMGYSKPIEPHHLHAIAEKVIELMPTRADLCGWSLGGLVAMRAALLQPDSVRRLVLIGSTPRFVNIPSDDAETAWDIGIEAEVFKKFAEQVDADYQGTLMKFFTLQCMGSSDARATIKQLRQSFAERPSASTVALQRSLDLLLDNDLRAEIPSLKRPVLLVHGDRDTLAPVQAAHWMAHHLPVSRLRVIAGASHAPFLSHPDEFVDALAQFLESVTIP